MDVSRSIWRYYDRYYVVLVEVTGIVFERLLMPFIPPDDADAIPPDKLYRAANPRDFEQAFTPQDTLMEKIRLGLLIALVIGLFFLIWIWLRG